MNTDTEKKSYIKNNFDYQNLRQEMCKTNIFIRQLTS